MTDRRALFCWDLALIAVSFSLSLATTSVAQERMKEKSDAIASFSSPAATVTPDRFTGVLQTAYPLNVPEVRGVRPDLTLVYRSGNGNGPLGVGWDLALGEIMRQSRREIDYGGDRFAYRSSSGVETLIATSDGYRTEVAARFERFEKRTGSDGRRSWAVIDTRGVVREFGTTDASRLSNPANPDQIFAWRLARVTDPNGNVILLSYVKDSAQLYLDEILYAESRGIVANVRISFIYEERPDFESSYQLGFLLTTTRRLKQVLVDADGKRLPSYELQYGDSAATKRSLLRAIVLRAADGQSMPPTQFEYQGSAVTFATPVWSGGAAPGTPATNCVAGDFDGNSSSDIACQVQGGSWSIALSTGHGWTVMLLNGPNVGTPVSNQCRVGDYDRDGRDDLLCYSGSKGIWHRMLGSDAGWGASAFIGGPAPGLPIGRQCLQGDFNADGRADLACYTTVRDEWHVVYATDDGFTGEMLHGPIVPDVGARCVAIDYDADTRSDIVCYSGAGSEWKLWRSAANGWSLSSIKGPVAGTPISDRCFLGQFNADLRPDTLCFTGVKNLWHLGLNTPAGFEGPMVEVARVAVPVTRQCAALDATGDGLTDIECFTGSGALWHIAVAHERSFQVEAVVSGPLPGNSVGMYCVPGDFSADGKGDLACHSGGGAWTMALSDGMSSDLLNRMQNPLGGSVSFGYSRAAAMPGNRLPLCIDVLATATSDDGVGTKSVTSYAYRNGRYNIRDRDFRGFGDVTVTEPSGGAVTRTRFLQGNATTLDRNDPNAEGAYLRGRPSLVSVFDEKGLLLRETAFQYGESTSFPRFNPVRDVRTRICERDDVCQQTRVAFSYDEYGNVIQELNYGDLATTDDDLTRTLTYARNPSKNIVALVTSEELRTGVAGGVRITYAETLYDGGGDSCTQASGTVLPVRGNATVVRRWIADGSPAAETLTAYDEYGNITCIRGPLGARTRFEFNAQRQFLLATVNALGHRTAFTYYGVAGTPVDGGFYGLLRTITDANGAVASKEYDRFGREQRDISATGASTKFLYVGLGRPGEQYIRADHSAGLSTFTYLDGEGREIKSRRSSAAGKFTVKTMRYDARGLLIAESLPYYEGAAPIGEIVTTYDALRQPVRWRHPGGAERVFCRQDGVTDFIDENDHRTREVRTATGRLRRVENYKGRFAHTCPAATIDGSAATAPYSVAVYTFDPTGRLTAVTDAKGAVTMIEHNGLGFRTRVVDPYTGERRFLVDTTGNVLREITASGNTIYAMYDLLGRIVQKSFGMVRPLGQGEILWTYDEPRSNGIGRPTSTYTREVTKAIHYDSGGRILRVEREMGGRKYVISKVYDDIDRVLRMTYPDGATVMYEYDGPVLTRVLDGATAYAQLSDYNAAGAVGRIRYGNGVTTVQTYETPSNPICPSATYRVCSSTTTSPTGKLLHEMVYEYDLLGNVTGLRELNEVRRFQIDEVNRVTAAMKSVGGGPFVVEERFEYDAANNITWKTGVGSYLYVPASAALRPHAPHRAGDNALIYDLDGNLVSGFGHTYAFTMEGQLAAIDDRSGLTQYFYDESQNLVRELTGTVSTIHVDHSYECSSAGCVKHVFAGSMKVATVGNAGAVVYEHLDAQGNTRLVTNRRGDVEVTYRYSTFGTPVATGAMPPFMLTVALFGGHLFAREHGIHLMNGRPYDPLFGRFLSPDPLFVASGPNQTLNRFAYGFNNPMTFTDPDGRFPWAILIGAVIGAVIGGTNAYLSGGEWKQGALIGAVTGAFTGGAYAFSADLGLVTRTIVFSAAGGMSGAAGAALGGGDIGMGAAAGALFGGVTGGINHDFAFLWTGFAENPITGIASQLANTALRGAAFNGLRAAVTGGHVWDAMRDGAIHYALGEALNMGIGHIVGFVGTGAFSPRWESGSFVYEAKGWAGITFSNVISADSGMNRVWEDVVGHEIGHTWQSLFLGPAYIPAHGLSLSISSLLSGGDSHRFGILERYWHPHPHW
jgi:RHS repeat-associated protein